MTKTANYQLNQWGIDDRICRTDFNEDNAKIDAALSTAYSADNVPWETGSLDLSTAEVGDVVKSFDFAPTAIFLYGAAAYVSVGTDGNNFMVRNTAGNGNRFFTMNGNALTMTAITNSPTTALSYLALR